MTVPVEREIVRDDPAAPRVAELSAWRSNYGLVAGVTTRAGAHGEFDLSLAGKGRGGGTAEEERWQEIARTFAPQFPGLTVSRQVHGAKVHQHPRQFTGTLVLDGYDGHVTDQAGIVLTVTLADCVPVYLADPSSGAIALLHAGWRGIACGVLERGIECLAELSGASPARFIMHCGVAISGREYEVGGDVAAQLGLAATGAPLKVDLRQLLARRAEGAGVGHITVSPWCTFGDVDLFFSHRRDGNAAGRMIAYLGRPLT